MVGVLRLLPLVFRLKFEEKPQMKHKLHSGSISIRYQDAVKLTWREHVLECETLDSSIGRIFYYIHRMDIHRGDPRYVFLHVFYNKQIPEHEISLSLGFEMQANTYRKLKSSEKRLPHPSNVH